MLELVLASELPAFVGLVILWALLGATVGALAGLVLFLAARALGAFRLEWRHGKWLRLLAALALVVACGAAGATAGVAEGTDRGVRRAVHEGAFRTGVLDRAGEVGALGFAWVDLLLRSHEAGSGLRLRAGDEARLRRFVRGEEEIHPGEFLARLGKAEEKIATEAVAVAKAKVLAGASLPAGGLAEKLVGEALEFLARRVLREKVRETFETRGADVVSFFEGLPAAARATGNPDTIGYRELAAHVVEGALVPAIAKPARSLARGQQVASAALAAGVLLLVCLAFAAGRWMERRRPGAPPATIPAP